MLKETFIIEYFSGCLINESGGKISFSIRRYFLQKINKFAKRIVFQVWRKLKHFYRENTEANYSKSGHLGTENWELGGGGACVAGNF